jgi:hypothetical protein
VADWPRSIVLGSAKKETLGALGGGGGASTLGGGGGGGGGGGTFFLQPATVKNRETASNKTLIFRLLILNFASCGSGKLVAWLCCNAPVSTGGGPWSPEIEAFVCILTCPTQA